MVFPDAGPASAGAIETLKNVLIDPKENLGRRYRALFSLKHVAKFGAEPVPAIEAMAAGFIDDSELLKHEIAYCLGQTKNTAAMPFLHEVLKDLKQQPMVRHEAAEALGAIGDNNKETMALLQKYRDDPNEIAPIRETCELACTRIEWENSAARETEKLKASEFGSIDPAPPSEYTESLESLEQTLLDPKESLFKRYRAMFGLRELASSPDLPTTLPAVKALGKAFADDSALFKHEIAFVLGEIAHPASIPDLERVLADLSQADMVRHEAAEALGSLGEEPGVEEILLKYLHDDNQVVRESIIVALDMAAYEKGEEAEYALIPESTNA